jgi:hypothetical protein
MYLNAYFINVIIIILCVLSCQLISKDTYHNSFKKQTRDYTIFPSGFHFNFLLLLIKTSPDLISLANC